MGGCPVCIVPSGGSDDPNDFESHEIRRARVEHACCECKKIIVKGERYERASAGSEGRIWSSKTCLFCVEVRDGFACEGAYTVGALWTEIAEVIFPNFNGACLEKLTTEPAKRHLSELWWAWVKEQTTLTSS